MSGKPIRLTNFEIDFLPGHKFAGHASGETWNGFACPRFDFEQAQKLAAIWQVNVGNVQYIASEDAFLFEPIDGAEEAEKFVAETINGIKFYSIGAGFWIWSEASE